MSLHFLDKIIIREIEVSDFGGAAPALTLRKSGNAYLIVEVPPAVTIQSSIQTKKAFQKSLAIACQTGMASRAITKSVSII